ncbi:MAG: glycosyltransferase family 4 protein [Promethearchaeia archaeon]
MKNILFFPTRFFPAISGAEFYIQRIAEIFQQQYNYNVRILTSNAIDFKALREKSGKLIDEDNQYFRKVNNLEIERYPIDYKMDPSQSIAFLNSFSPINSLNLSKDCLLEYLYNGPYLKDFFNIWNEKKSEVHSYDLIHTTFYPYFNLILTLYLGRILDIPTVCTPFYHYSNPRYSNHQLTEPLHKFDLLIACTEREKTYLIKEVQINKQKIKVIPMGVDFRRYQRVHNETFKDYSFKEKFFRANNMDYKLVLYCGYKNYEKGAVSILKSIPPILNDYPRVYFVFIGPSTKAFEMQKANLSKSMRKQILNFTPDNMKGYFDKKKMTAFSEADIYVMPSRSDAFGITYLEAWSSATPVIGANTGATPEVIQHNKNGLLVEFDNPQEIANQILKLLRDERLSRRLGKSGQKRVKTNFTWKKVVKQTNNTYIQLINNYIPIHSREEET